MPATLVLTAIYGDMLLAAAALGTFGLAAATFAIRLVATQVITSLIAKRQGQGAGGNGTVQIGNRVQLPPATDNKIGVVYGTAFMKPIIIDAKISTDQQTMWYVLAFSEAMNNDSIGTFSFGDFYFGDKKLTFDETDPTKVVSWTDSNGEVDTKCADKIYVYHYRDGSSNGVNTTSTAYAILADSEIPEAARWTSDKKMTKLVFSIIKLKYDRDAGITGLADITAVITNSLSKPGLVIKDYLTNTRYGAGLNVNKVSTSTLTLLDGYADETISYTASGGGTTTMARYRINGPVDTTKNFLDNLVDITESCDSWLQWNETTGQWGVIPNRSYLDLDPGSSQIRQIGSSQIIGGIDINPIDLNSTYNSVEVQFPNTKIKDQPGYHIIDIESFPNVDRSPNEPDNKLSVSLPFTNNIVQAQYIAARRLLQSREDLVINFTMDYSGIQIDAGDVIGIHHERYGWGEYNELAAQPYGKLFRVTQVQEGKSDDGSLYARIAASEYNDDVYDDNNIDLADFTPSLNTGISDPTIISTPSAPQIINTSTNANVPSFTVRGLIPATGTTLAMEYWYGTTSTISGNNYTLYSTELPSGSPVFAKSSTQDVIVTGLGSGTYYWRCRAIGSRTKSGFSNATSITWAPTVIADVIGKDIFVNFTPPSLGVPRLGTNLVPQYQNAILKAFGQVNGGQVNYVNATTDSSSTFIANTWRIGNAFNTGYTTPGVVTTTNVAFTLSNITTTGNGGVQFPAPYAMNSSTASLSIPVRFKDAVGNIYQTYPATAQLVFVDQGAEGPSGLDGVSPAFIDLSAAAGGFSLSTASVFTPSTIKLTATQQNVNTPIPLWTVVGADYILSTTTGTNTFTNNTIEISPYTTSNFVTVRVDIDLYSKTVTLPITREVEGPQGIPGEYAGRGFIPLAYVPITVDPTLASQEQLTTAWTSATGYAPIANDGGSFWYNDISENYTFNGTTWIAAILQIAGNLIADGTITANQMNANSIFTNRLASTNQADDFGNNIGPGYWLDGSSGDAYFGGNVQIGENLNVSGLIESAVLISNVVDTNTIVPGAVTEASRSFYEGTKSVTPYNAVNETTPQTYAWTTGTRGLALSAPISIVPTVDAANGGRIFLEFSTTLYSNSVNPANSTKNLLELWRRGNILNTIRFKQLQMRYTAGDNFASPQASVQSAMILGTPQPFNVNEYHYVRLYNQDFGSSTTNFIPVTTIPCTVDYTHVFSQRDIGIDTDRVNTTTNYWLFGASSYAKIETTTSTYDAYTTLGTLVEPTYGTLQVVTNTGTSKTYSNFTNNVSAVKAYPRDSNYDGVDQFHPTTAGTIVWMGDDLGQVWVSSSRNLPNWRIQLEVAAGTRKPKIKDFDWGYSGSIFLIGVGEGGRIVRGFETPGAGIGVGGISNWETTSKLTWTEQTFGTYNLNAICSNVDWGDEVNGPQPGSASGRMIIVGDLGTILYSSNWGQTWAKVASGTLENLTGVACQPSLGGSNLFVAVGTNGVILRSLNGLTWTKETLPATTSTGAGQNYIPDFQSISYVPDLNTHDYPVGSVSWGLKGFNECADDIIRKEEWNTTATIITNTATIVNTTASSALIWKRLWYLGSNSNPFDNSEAPVGARLSSPSATVGVVITDSNYVADPGNNLSYDYYVVVGNLGGFNTSTFVTNTYLSATEFKR